LIKLIKIELKKLFRKKSFYVISLIFIAFCILTNVIYKKYDSMNYIDDNIDITELKSINKTLDLSNSTELEEYVSNISTIEIAELKTNFKNNTQLYLIDNLYDLIYAKYEAKYILQDQTEERAISLEIENKLTKIKNNEWQFFTKEKIEKYQSLIANTDDIIAQKKFKEVIKLEEYRLNNNVGYDNNNYLFNAIEEIETDLPEYYNLENKATHNKLETERLSFLKEEMAINNYILDNKADINNPSSINAILKKFANEFSIFILIYVIMICGSIMSEEFSKGTIKYLLTKPYKRSTILTAKLLTVLLLIPIIILFMVLIEFLIGGIILGFQGIDIPVIIYNPSTKLLVSYNIFIYTFMQLLSIFPAYLVLGIICFSLSTITASTSAATTITFLFYLISNVIVTLVKAYNISFLKYFVSIHWDFSYLLNFAKHPFGFNTFTSMGITIIYIIVILCLTYLYFAKKDVKNI